MPMPHSTVSYYDSNANLFFAETVVVEMEPLYAPFLAHLAPGAHLLDAGCGSGRDARAFRERGYTVTAFDASPALAVLASAHCGIEVQVRCFQDLDWRAAFDGIWACASLLHVPLAELPEVLVRLAVALKPEGVLYASFKYGSGEREHGGRSFTDLDEVGLGALVERVPRLVIQESWVTHDRRPGREQERWLNGLLRNGTHA